MKKERELKILLTKAAKDPYYVFTNKDCVSPAFCGLFFEQCNEVMFNEPARALEIGFVARRLSEETRDRHLQAKALSMVASGYRVECLFSKAHEFIREAEALARNCDCCMADILRRKGIVLYFQNKFDKQCAVLSESIERYQTLGVSEGVGRVLIHRGTGLCMLGRIEEAFQDERRGLELLTADTPSRYYVAGITNLAGILAYSEEDDPERYAEALFDLHRVRQSLKGERRRHEHVRVILRWIEGLIYAKKGERRTAFRLLASAKNGLERLNMWSEYLAISADIAKLYKTGTPRANDDQVVEIATQCLERVSPSGKERRILDELRACPEVPVIETLRAAVQCRVPALL